jgi:three-Cys-motif partner protein
MATDDAFWSAPQGAARFKHRVIRNQLAAFAGKTGSTAAGQQGVFLDGYAGPGAYDVGDPGSPGIAVEVVDSLKKLRNLEGVFIEVRAKYAHVLRKRLDERGYSHWTVRKGSCEERAVRGWCMTSQFPTSMMAHPSTTLCC